MLGALPAAKPPRRAWRQHRSGWPPPAAPGTWGPWPPRWSRPRPCWRWCPRQWSTCPWIGAQVLSAAAPWNCGPGTWAKRRPRSGGHRRRPGGGQHPRAGRAVLGILRWPTRCGAGERAAGTAGDAERLPAPITPAAHVALAAVHVERNDLRQAHGDLNGRKPPCWLHPDRLTGTVACLVAARKALAEGHPDSAVEIVRKARTGWRYRTGSSGGWPCSNRVPAPRPVMLRPRSTRRGGPTRPRSRRRSPRPTPGWPREIRRRPGNRSRPPRGRVGA